jgi:DNA polymerase-3 subunit alpha (Gram-positive type)
VEAYYKNDVDDRVAAHGGVKGLLNAPVVVFDIETTGLDSRADAITEIGAVVLENGEVTDRFQTFVDPGRRLSPEIVNLTGITDEMVAGAPSQQEAVTAFLKFAEGRTLCAHNAEFDVGFIAEACRRVGKSFDNAYLDTLVLAQNLLPGLGRYKLDVVAEYLKVPSFQHHRATDDAEACAYLLRAFQGMLRKRGINTLEEINPAMVSLRAGGSARRTPRHIIILVRNKTGLRNLYKLISLSHLKFFKRFPIMPKSVIDQNREGLILGSACEAGEVFQAVMRGKSREELHRLASWYDYLEIQPLSNNGFMLRPERGGRTLARDEEELRQWNRAVVRLGGELGKPVCATGDVHFLDPEDEECRHVLLDAKGFDDVDAPNPMYFRTTAEMLEEFTYLGGKTARAVVIENPNQVAGWCEDIKPLPDGLFTPRLENSAEELKSLVWGKARELYGEDPPAVVVDRINAELGDIIGCKYDVIYMSAQKLVQNSLDAGYLVGSRGSVVPPWWPTYPASPRSTRCPHITAVRCASIPILNRGRGTAAAPTCPTRCVRSAMRPMRRTASASPSRPFWASAATRCPTSI